MCRPVSAESFVEGDEVGGNGAGADGKRKLGLLDATLGIEHVEEGCQPALVALPREHQRIAILRERRGNRIAPALLGAVSYQRVLHLVHRIQHGARIIVARNTPPSIGW